MGMEIQVNSLEDMCSLMCDNNTHFNNSVDEIMTEVREIVDDAYQAGYKDGKRDAAIQIRDTITNTVKKFTEVQP